MKIQFNQLLFHFIANTSQYKVQCCWFCSIWRYFSETIISLQIFSIEKSMKTWFFVVFFCFILWIPHAFRHNSEKSAISNHRAKFYSVYVCIRNLKPIHGTPIRIDWNIRHRWTVWLLFYFAYLVLIAMSNAFTFIKSV